MSAPWLTNHFLVAMPGMTDPNFARSVTLVCEHGPQGALGVTINRPLGMTLADVFAQLGLEAAPTHLADQPVLRGGPVQTERGFVLHTPGGAWESTLPVSDQLHLTTSRDVLAALAEGGGPDAAVVALGYAGWDAGQLEAEVAENAWLTVPADARLVFETPLDDRWEAACRLIGVDARHLSRDAGHA